MQMAITNNAKAIDVIALNIDRSPPSLMARKANGMAQQAIIKLIIAAVTTAAAVNCKKNANNSKVPARDANKPASCALSDTYQSPRPQGFFVLILTPLFKVTCFFTCFVFAALLILLS